MANIDKQLVFSPQTNQNVVDVVVEDLGVGLEHLKGITRALQDQISSQYPDKNKLYSGVERLAECTESLLSIHDHVLMQKKGERPTSKPFTLARLMASLRTAKDVSLCSNRLTIHFDHKVTIRDSHEYALNILLKSILGHFLTASNDNTVELTHQYSLQAGHVFLFLSSESTQQIEQAKGHVDRMFIQPASSMPAKIQVASSIAKAIGISVVYGDLTPKVQAALVIL